MVANKYRPNDALGKLAAAETQAERTVLLPVLPETPFAPSAA